MTVGSESNSSTECQNSDHSPRVTADQPPAPKLTTLIRQTHIRQALVPFIHQYSPLPPSDRPESRPHLGLVERQDELLIVEDVALGGEQHVQDLVLDGAQLRLVGVDLHDQLVAGLLDLGLLQSHHVPAPGRGRGGRGQQSDNRHRAGLIRHTFLSDLRCTEIQIFYWSRRGRHAKRPLNTKFSFILLYLPDSQSFSGHRYLRLGSVFRRRKVQ